MWNIYNLTKPKNTNAGLVEQLFVAPADWFEEVKQPKPPFLEKGDTVSIFEDHIFKPGKGFIELRLAPDKSQYRMAATGDKGSMGFTHTIEAFVPGSYALLHSVVKSLLNTPLVALIKDAQCGESWYYQLGGCEKYAYLSASFTTGTDSEGAKGYSLQLSINKKSAQLYFGAVQKFEAELALLKPLFLAPQQYTAELDDYESLRSAYFNNLVTDIELMFTYVQHFAGNEIVTLAIANDKGFFATETWSEFPVHNYADFIDFIENWLLINGDGRTLVNDNGMLKIKDSESNNCYMALQVPDELFSGAGGVLQLGGNIISL